MYSRLAYSKAIEEEGQAPTLQGKDPTPIVASSMLSLRCKRRLSLALNVARHRTLLSSGVQPRIFFLQEPLGFSDVLDIDISDAIERKLRKIAEKYPVMKIPLTAGL